jgi:hypothetical protein
MECPTLPTNGMATGKLRPAISEVLFMAAYVIYTFISVVKKDRGNR